MNASFLDSVWQAVRYSIISVGSLLTGVNYAVGDQNMALISASAAIVAAAWGFYVKIRTVPVLESVVKAADLPTVSSATGGKVSKPSVTQTIEQAALRHPPRLKK